MINQITFLVALVVGGAYLGYWFRRFDMSGFELWFPMGMIVAYAYSPLAGFIVAFSMLLITWALFPYSIIHLAITSAGFGTVFFLTTQFPVTELTFVKMAMLLAVGFQVGTNLIYFLTGYPWIRIVKFAAVNLLFSWLIFNRFGWDLIMWLQG